jgi:hypothetical protein
MSCCVQHLFSFVLVTEKILQIYVLKATVPLFLLKEGTLCFTGEKVRRYSLTFVPICSGVQYVKLYLWIFLRKQVFCALITSQNNDEAKKEGKNQTNQ